MNFAMPSQNSNASPIVSIKVVGVGGAGNNAVNRMIASGVKGAQFISVNTDKQMLLMNKAQIRLQIGEKMTKGQGAGSDPFIGKKAAEESESAIRDVLKDTDLLFITAGMGGGTGTGAAPVIASIAKDMGILTVAIVTKPFEFEGQYRMHNAEVGIDELKKIVDTIVVIPNSKLSKILPRNTSALQAFMYADDVLRQGIQGISDIIVKPNMINLDFADIKKILQNKGVAHMGIGHGKGENKMMEAVQQAVASPLLETSIEGATGLLFNIRYCVDFPLVELDEMCSLIRKAVSPNCNIIHGNGADDSLVDEVEITVIATGFGDGTPSVAEQAYGNFSQEKVEPFNYSKQSYAEFKEKSAEPNREANEAASNLFTRSEKPAISSIVQSDSEEEDDDIPPFLKRLRKKNNI